MFDSTISISPPCLASRPSPVSWCLALILAHSWACAPQDMQAQDSGASSTNAPALNFFSLTHIHVYDDGAVPTETQFQALAAPVEQLADTMERHGLRGTFETVPMFATAALRYQGANNILVRLEARGHEIGGHAHQQVDVRNSYQALISAGVKNVKTIGAAAAKLDPTAARMDLAAQAGYLFYTHNASPTDKKGGADWCADFGLGGNTMFNETQNLMHPWRPKSQTNFCAHDNAGRMVYIDSAIPDWWFVDGIADPTVTDSAFAKTKPWLEAALRHVDANQVNVWGIVTHQIGEYTKTYDSPSELAPEGFAALDRYLTYVDALVATGKVKYATVSQIGAQFIQSEARCTKAGGVCDYSGSPSPAVPDAGAGADCNVTRMCPPSAVCCPPGMPCAGACIPDCRVDGGPGCPPFAPVCTPTGMCQP